MNAHFLEVLRNKSFLFVWLSEVFSQLAANMSLFILLLVAFSLTNSNTAVAGILVSFSLPAIFFAIFAGAFVDRQNKKYVLVWTNAVRAILLILLAFAHQNLLLLYAFTFAISMVTQFFIPAEAPMIPLIVEKNQLLRANALFSIAYFGSVFLAYALSGPVILLLGVTNSLLVLSVSFLVATIFAWAIKTRSPYQKRDTKGAQIGVMQEVKEFISFVMRIGKLFHSFILLILSQTFILTIAAIGPGYARYVLHIPIESFPLVFITPAIVGLAIGTFFLAHFHRISKQTLITLGMLLSSTAIFLLPFANRVASKNIVIAINLYLPHLFRITFLHILVLLAFLLGLANAFVFVPANTILQEETTDAMRGKIYGTLNALTALVSLIPILVSSALADIFGVSVVFVLLGVVFGGLGIYRLIFAKKFS